MASFLNGDARFRHLLKLLNGKGARKCVRAHIKSFAPELPSNNRNGLARAELGANHRACRLTSHQSVRCKNFIVIGASRTSIKLD
jgi:hypothetical protein